MPRLCKRWCGVRNPRTDRPEIFTTFTSHDGAVYEHFLGLGFECFSQLIAIWGSNRLNVPFRRVAPSDFDSFRTAPFGVHWVQPRRRFPRHRYRETMPGRIIKWCPFPPNPSLAERLRKRAMAAMGGLSLIDNLLPRLIYGSS